MSYPRLLRMLRLIHSWDPSNHRALSSSKARLTTVLICLLIFTVTKIISSNRPLIDVSAISDESSVQGFADRENCQIIYILGVEGAMHHGLTPIIEKLARMQVDPVTGAPFDVTYPARDLRQALFGFHGEMREMDNPKMIRETIRQICPHNGIKHVVIEDASFPCGKDDDMRGYRIHRQRWWLDAKMEKIAMSETAKNHPTNLYKFYESYLPYAEIKFLVIHRSYIETVAAHADLDNTPEQHSVVIRGFMLLIRRFLDSLPVDTITGKQLWSLVCVERMTEKFYGDKEEQMHFARQRILSYLTEFLGWYNDECPECYSDWRNSKKNHVSLLGEEKVSMLLEHMRKLGGIWPPEMNNPLPEQKCSL